MNFSYQYFGIGFLFPEIEDRQNVKRTQLTACNVDHKIFKLKSV